MSIILSDVTIFLDVDSACNSLPISFQTSSNPTPKYFRDRALPPVILAKTQWWLNLSPLEIKRSHCCYCAIQLGPCWTSDIEAVLLSRGPGYYCSPLKGKAVKNECIFPLTQCICQSLLKSVNITDLATMIVLFCFQIHDGDILRAIQFSHQYIVSQSTSFIFNSLIGNNIYIPVSRYCIIWITRILANVGHGSVFNDSLIRIC